METLSIFLNMAGFIVGLGAVTVIDLHGFLGIKSSYWTEATIRTHKITKPLIWIGTFLILISQIIMKSINSITYNEFIFRLLIILALIINGIFLSFIISPILLKKEKEGKAQELLEKNLQIKISISFVISFLGWWSMVYLFASSVTN